MRCRRRHQGVRRQPWDNLEQGIGESSTDEQQSWHMAQWSRLSFCALGLKAECPGLKGPLVQFEVPGRQVMGLHRCGQRLSSFADRFYFACSASRL